MATKQVPNSTYAPDGSLYITPTDGNGNLISLGTTTAIFTASASGLVPASGGGTTNFLRADGTWAIAGNVAGSNTQVQFNNSGVFGASPNLTWISPTLTIGVAGSATGQLAMTGATSGTVTITPQATAGTPTLTLPNATGTFAVSGTSPVAVSATTGAISVSTATATASGLVPTPPNNTTTFLRGDATFAVLTSTTADLTYEHAMILGAI